jgi:hypothetical protein
MQCGEEKMGKRGLIKSDWGFRQELKGLITQIGTVLSYIDHDPKLYRAGLENEIAREASELKEDIQIYLEEK